MKKFLSEVLEYCTKNNRVCPNPNYWSKLFQMLPNKKRDISGHFRNPSAPLILAAWHLSGDSEKRTRMEEHIRYAYAEGVLEEIYKFIKTLNESDWHHSK